MHRIRAGPSHHVVVKRGLLLLLAPSITFALLLVALLLSGTAWHRHADPPSSTIIDETVQLAKWSTFDEKGASESETARAALLASLEHFWGWRENGERVQVQMQSRVRTRYQQHDGVVYVTLLGNVSWMANASSNWTPYAPGPSSSTTNLPAIQFRSLPCQPAGSLTPGTPSADKSVLSIVILGACVTEVHPLRPTASSLGISLYLETERAAQRADVTRRQFQPKSVVLVYAVPDVTVTLQSGVRNGSSKSGLREWERRRSNWWGWEVLSGRGRGGGRSRLARASSRREELLKLQSFLAVRHLALERRILLLWPPGEGSTSPAQIQIKSQAQAWDALLHTLLAQIGYLQERGALPLLTALPIGGTVSPSQIPLSLLCGPLLLTRKHHPDCFPQSKLLPLLVTSLGGAGTHAAADALQQHAGAAIQHEGIGAAGAVAWMYAINDAAIDEKASYPFRAALPTSARGLLTPRFSRVAHLVRHPLKHISSFGGHLRVSHIFVQFAATGLARDLEPLLSHFDKMDASASSGSAGLSISIAHLRRLHALATSVVVTSVLPLNVQLNPSPLFPALAWLLWDALCEMQSDARISVESYSPLHLAETLCALASQGDAAGCVIDAEGQEAGLVQVLFSLIYRCYNAVAGFARPRVKRPHSAHVEWTWDDLRSLSSHPLPGVAVDVFSEVRSRSALYGYDVAQA